MSLACAFTECSVPVPCRFDYLRIYLRLCPLLHICALPARLCRVPPAVCFSEPVLLLCDTWEEAIYAAPATARALGALQRISSLVRTPRSAFDASRGFLLHHPPALCPTFEVSCVVGTSPSSNEYATMILAVHGLNKYGYCL